MAFSTLSHVANTQLPSSTITKLPVFNYSGVTPGGIPTVLPIAVSNIVRIRNGCTVLGDREWYHSVKPDQQPKDLINSQWGNGLKYQRKALFDVYTYEQCLPKFVVCNNVIHEGKPLRLFSLFNTPMEFFDYQADIQDNLNKTFLEIIFGDRPQKQHFDIDITADMMSKFGLSQEHITCLQQAEDFDKQQRLKLLNIIVSPLPQPPSYDLKAIVDKMIPKDQNNTKANDQSQVNVKLEELADRKSPLTLQSPRGVVSSDTKSMSPQPVMVKVRPEASLIAEATSAYDKLIHDILLQILAAIVDEYRSRNIQLTLKDNFAIYTSHSVYKRSYHIIIDGYYHVNNKACKAVYRAIAKRLKKDIADLIDHMVYSSFQQFRLLGSQKPQSCRPKAVLRTLPLAFTKITGEDKLLSIPGVIDQHHPTNVSSDCSTTDKAGCDITKGLVANSLSEFMRSVVTNIDHCKLVDVPEALVAKTSFASNDLTDKQVERAYKLVDKIGVDDVSFTIDKVTGGMIMLKRRAPSYCMECKRTHNAENPYIIVINGAVYYCCRRNDTKVFVGNLVADNATEVEIEALVNASIDDQPIFGLGDSKLTFNEGKQVITKSNSETKSAVTTNYQAISPPTLNVGLLSPIIFEVPPVTNIVVDGVNITATAPLSNIRQSATPTKYKKFKGVEVNDFSDMTEPVLMNASNKTIINRKSKPRLL